MPPKDPFKKIKIMNLELKLIRKGVWPTGQKASATFDQTGGAIGRDDSCRFILRCKNGLVSRLHAKIDFRDGRFYIHGTSTKGVFLNHAKKSIGKNGFAPLEDNDIITVGDFEMKVRLIDDMKTTTLPSSLPARNTAEFGHPNDHFNPPKPLIPEHWELDLSRRSQTPADVVADKAPIDFSNDQQRHAIDALLRGLGLEGSLTAESIKPEALELIGQCLRTTLSNLLNLRDSQAEMERHLSTAPQTLPAIKPELQPLGDIRSVDELLERLMTSYDGDSIFEGREILENLHKMIEGQHVFMVESLTKISDFVADRFSPERIESLYNKAVTNLEKESFMNRRLSRRLNPKASRWDFFRTHFDRLRKQSYITSRHSFEKIFLAVYAKRLRDAPRPPANTGEEKRSEPAVTTN
ncbi:MAG: FHA domain-containing protein [Gammaproteobacteria bacterium]|nr:FHA domain-containing protein [Gammaproteobacteria bacterium]